MAKVDGSSSLVLTKRIVIGVTTYSHSKSCLISLTYGCPKKMCFAVNYRLANSSLTLSMFCVTLLHAFLTAGSRSFVK